jgi:hypothetical protein
MKNEITINIEELLKVEDNSITDYETIRQIGLLSCTVNNISKEIKQILYKKVKNEFQYMGLYPNIMKTFDIIPDKN